MSTSTFLPPIVIHSTPMVEQDLALHVYTTVFVPDFIDSVPDYQGNPLSVKMKPFRNGYCATFWHMITEGPDENNRIILPDRCYKLPWVKAVISNCTDPSVVIWENTRGKNTRICLWYNRSDGILKPDSYLVVLEKRIESSGRVVYLPWTAYPVDRAHTARKLEKEYQNYIKSI